MKKIISIVLIVLTLCFLGIGSLATGNDAPADVSSPTEQDSSETNVGGSDAPTSTTEEYNFSGVIIIGLSLGLIVLMSVIQVRKERR